MPPQFGGQRVAFPTDEAAVGSLSGVQPLVRLQTVWVPQRFPTVAAEEAPSGVGEHVPAEIRFLGEALAALGAGKRLLSAVSSQMALQVPFLTEALPAVLTDVRLLPRVQLHVIPQGVGVGQQLGADCTLQLRGLCVGHTAAVKEAVDPQGGAPCECFATMLAGVRFLPGVQDHVLLQVSLQTVGFITVRAGEWTLAAVTHLMSSEAFCGGVAFPTVLTGEGFLVCVAELVFLQVADLVELFTAGGASVAPLSGLWLTPGSLLGWMICPVRLTFGLGCV